MCLSVLLAAGYPAAARAGIDLNTQGSTGTQEGAGNQEGNGADAVAMACSLPAVLLTQAHKLPHTATALAGHRLEILALGSGSTVGDTGGANGPAMAFHAPGASFPYRMAAALRLLRPGLQVDLTVDGARSLSAHDMLPMLRETLARRHVDLVVWQTGTVEAMRASRPAILQSDLGTGASVIREAGADLVLVDPQFSRFLRANADLGPYETILRGVAAQDAVPLFPRYELTQDWAASGQVDPERAQRDAREQTIFVLNDCLGEALARFILYAAVER